MARAVMLGALVSPVAVVAVSMPARAAQPVVSYDFEDSAPTSAR